MASLRHDGRNLAVVLTAAEKAEGVHGRVSVPFASIISAEPVEDPIGLVHVLSVGGLKVVGTYLPGLLAVGTFRGGSGAKPRFIAVHHGHRQGVRILLDGAHYSEILISCDSAGEAISLIQGGRQGR